MKFKSKPSYLGEKNSILPRQMSELEAIEVDVKNPDGEEGGEGGGGEGGGHPRI